MIKVGVVTENALKQIREKMTERHIQEAKAAPPSCLPRIVKRQVREGRPARCIGEDNAPVQVGRKSEGIPADIAHTGFGEEATKPELRNSMCMRAMHYALFVFVSEWNARPTMQQAR